MVKKQKLFRKLVNSPQNSSFQDFQAVAEAFGFQLARIKGSHHIYQHPAVDESLNLQDRKGRAVAYQVSQLLVLVEKYNLEIGDEVK